MRKSGIMIPRETLLEEFGIYRSLWKGDLILLLYQIRSYARNGY